MQRGQIQYRKGDVKHMKQGMWDKSDVWRVLYYQTVPAPITGCWVTGLNAAFCTRKQPRIDHWQYGAISDISINANDLIWRDSKQKHCCTVCTQKISPTKTQPRLQSLSTKFFWVLPKMHHGGLFLLVWHYCHLLARSVSLRELNHLIQVWSVRWWSLNMGGMQNTRS